MIVVVYFIKAKGSNLVKIGKSINFEKRLRSLQTMSPLPLCKLAVLNGYTERERDLHKKFSKYREHGEWFIYSAEIKRFLESNKEDEECALERDKKTKSERNREAAKRASHLLKVRKSIQKELLEQERQKQRRDQKLKNIPLKKLESEIDSVINREVSIERKTMFIFDWSLDGYVLLKHKDLERPFLPVGPGAISTVRSLYLSKDSREFNYVCIDAICREYLAKNSTREPTARAIFLISQTLKKIQTGPRLSCGYGRNTKNFCPYQLSYCKGSYDEFVVDPLIVLGKISKLIDSFVDRLESLVLSKIQDIGAA